MAIALDEGRVVVTADLDYARLLALTRAEAPALILSAEAITVKLRR